MQLTSAWVYRDVLVTFKLWVGGFLISVKELLLQMCLPIKWISCWNDLSSDVNQGLMSLPTSDKKNMILQDKQCKGNYGIKRDFISDIFFCIWASIDYDKCVFLRSFKTLTQSKINDKKGCK